MPVRDILSNGWKSLTYYPSLTKKQKKHLSHLAHIYKKTLRQRDRYLKKITNLDKRADSIADQMVRLEVGANDYHTDASGRVGSRARAET